MKNGQSERSRQILILVDLGHDLKEMDTLRGTSFNKDTLELPRIYRKKKHTDYKCKPREIAEHFSQI